MILILRNNSLIKVDSYTDKIYKHNVEKVELINRNFSIFQIDYDEAVSWDDLQIGRFLYYSNKIREGK